MFWCRYFRLSNSDIYSSKAHTQISLRCWNHLQLHCKFSIFFYLTALHLNLFLFRCVLVSPRHQGTASRFSFFSEFPSIRNKRAHFFFRLKFAIATQLVQHLFLFLSPFSGIWNKQLYSWWWMQRAHVYFSPKRLKKMTTKNANPE